VIQIFEEGDDSGIVIKNQCMGKNVAILFPMTREKEVNIFRWEKLISTVNLSNVTALILIDKTPFHQATDYFARKEKEILANTIIFQRPRNEPTHDSQSLIKLENGLWIIQMHDDDDWEGHLEIPLGTNENSIVRTDFFLVSGGTSKKVTDPNWPDCRSIFSLLPSIVWNRFASLISEQGGHVAGSIDSSLNIAVSLIEPKYMSTAFKYFYDNRHWDSRKLSKQHLIRLTKEDGWGDFATIEMSLVSRAIDGIASLIFFSDLYSDNEFRLQINKWISATKPHILRTYLKKFEILFLVLGKNLLKVGGPYKLANLRRSCSNSILYRRILVSAWDAKKIEDYREIVEVLLGLQSLPLLQSRFYFWQRELNKNVPGNTKNERRDQWS
jgi:hypothetical protein